MAELHVGRVLRRRDPAGRAVARLLRGRRGQADDRELVGAGQGDEQPPAVRRDGERDRRRAEPLRAPDGDRRRQLHRLGVDDGDLIGVGDRDERAVGLRVHRDGLGVREVRPDRDVLDLRGGIEVDHRDGARRLVGDQTGLAVGQDRRAVGVVAGLDVGDGLGLDVDDRGRVGEVERDEQPAAVGRDGESVGPAVLGRRRRREALHGGRARRRRDVDRPGLPRGAGAAVVTEDVDDVAALARGVVGHLLGLVARLRRRRRRRRSRGWDPSRCRPTRRAARASGSPCAAWPRRCGRRSARGPPRPSSTRTRWARRRRRWGTAPGGSACPAAADGGRCRAGAGRARSGPRRPRPPARRRWSGGSRRGRRAAGGDESWPRDRSGRRGLRESLAVNA